MTAKKQNLADSSILSNNVVNYLKEYLQTPFLQTTDLLATML
jgi:hypothetical protein